MTAGTRRDHCVECDPERRKSKSRETYADGAIYCFRCHYRAKPCSSCGELFAHRHPDHDRCDECFGRAGMSRPQKDGAHKEPSKRSDVVPPRPAPDPDRLRAIWARTQPLRGTLGAVYLEHRRCVLPPVDSDLRYLPGSDRHPPSLCALVTDATSNKPLTLHFTKLAADGSARRDRRLLKDYPKRGGVIRLWSDACVTLGLGIAEGIETALSAAYGFTPMWSCIDAGNLAVFPVLAGIESLVVFADHDPAGLSAARAFGARWAEAGREVRLVVPERGDVNDAVAA